MSKKNLKEIYEKATAERDQHTNAILASTSRKIVVVAGPGTGKTTLFTRLLERKGKGGEALTLSFINALVDELSLDLFGLSEVKTLHGFSAGILRRTARARIFPKLSEVITEDAGILIDEGDVDFDKIFHQCEGDEKHIAFYKKRKDYYGTYYGFADAIYGLVKLFESKKDLIPQYSQVVVDEFQDFNKAEVLLIDLLAERSPILIAGDDDQSLYVDLKDASPDHIRGKHGLGSPDYVSFPLEFCSRSTQVIVEAVNDIINAATKNGLLKGRVVKPYRYFPCENGDKESAANPHLVYSQCYEGEMIGFMHKEISEIARGERSKFSVLVIVPPQLKNRILPRFAKALRKKGFHNVSYPEKTAERTPTLIEGLKILLENNDDNLGWRIVARCILDKAVFKACLQESDKGERMSGLVGEDCYAMARRLVRTLKKIRDGKTTQEDALKEFVEKVGYDPYRLVTEKLREELLADEAFAYDTPRGIRGVPITLTTIPSSKGLSADYVFITHFDDQYYTQNGKGAVSDKEVFSFLVGLTRARKKDFLISSKDENPVLLGWIDSARIEQRPDSPHKRRMALKKQTLPSKQKSTPPDAPTR